MYFILIDSWDTEHNLMIRKIYDHRAAKRLQQMMSNVCQWRNHLMTWIRPSIKTELEVHFRNDDGIKHCHLTNVANRTLPRSSKYTGGWVIFMKTKSRLSKSLDCEAILVETFKYTHTLKVNKGKFADERFGAHYIGGYDTAISVAYGNDEDDSETSVVDSDRVWHEIASKTHKNRHFRLGSFFASGLHSFVLVAFSASATNPSDLQEVVDLREEVQKLTQELHQQAEQSKQRHNDFLARIGGAVAIN
ncbi:hypothetical protein Ahy_A01g004398 [Arachis hypogaea]|uniref:Uncharacterized protein n=1 Tax=Arachis hypogaea TaxID=3818 RepID=A0A445EVZ5_ARAHY|nr:hypothetical protein Ahy_A01g004398 [Arachis hypogaea]